MITEKGEAYPPALRWTKRLAAGYALLLVAIVIAHLAWSHIANGRLQAMVDAAHAAGEPILVDDFKRPPIPDDENAVTYIRVAERSIALRNDVDWFDLDSIATGGRDPNDFNVPAALASPKEIEEANKTPLAAIRTARNLKHIDWQLPFQHPATYILLPDLNNVRSVTRLLAIAAVAAHERGDDAAAIEYLRDILFLSRSLGQQPFLVSDLVANGCTSLAVSAWRWILPDLAVASDTTTAPLNAASEAQVRAFIVELLDDKDISDGVRQAVLGERMVQTDFAVWIGEKQLVTRPLFRLSAMRMARRMSAVLSARDSATLPAARRTLPPNQRSIYSSPASRATHALELYLSPSLGRYAETSYRIRADRRMAALATAMRLYQLDHTGNRPKTLDELVPQYLAAVPADPMTEGGILRYHVSPPAYLYSLGANGKDDSAGGWRPGSATNTNYRLRDLDIPFMLDRPAAPSTREAGDE